MQGHLQAFYHRNTLALLSPSRGPQHRMGAALMFVWCLTCAFGCATVDLIEAPRPSASLEDILASEDTVSECLDTNVRPPIADDMQTPIWQDMVRKHLKECGAKLTLHYLGLLVSQPTIPGNIEARDLAKSLLLSFASKQRLTFTTIGSDDVWLLELGEGAPLADFVTMLDVQPGPIDMQVGRRRAHAHAVTTELDRIYGRGVEDNKTAIAALLTLFRGLAPFRSALSGRLRLIILPNAKSDLRPVAEWAEDAPRASNTFLLNSTFPATNEVLSAQDLTLIFRSDEGHPISANPWKIEALGGGHSATNTAKEGLLALQYLGNETTEFRKEVEYLGQLAEQKLRLFGGDLALDIRPFSDEFKVLVVARGASERYSSAQPSRNPLFFLGHLGYELDILQNHGTAALEVLMRLSAELIPQGRDSTTSPLPPLPLSASPVLLRFNAENALLRLRAALPYDHAESAALSSAEMLLHSVQDEIWSLTEWKDSPRFETGYRVEESAVTVRVAQKVFQKYFPEVSASLITEGEGTLARLFPKAIGFGPLLPKSARTSLSISESLPRSVVERWSRMLFDVVEKLPPEAD